MIVVIDTAKGQAHNFKTRKDAGEFIGVSLPTLRGWLANPFFLYQTLIITHTTNGKVKQSNQALRDKRTAKSRQDEIDRINAIHVQGVFPINADVRNINGSRPKEPAKVDGTN